MAELTFFDAAIKVLEDAGGGPLHYSDIARQALERGLVQTSGLTPDATMGAILYSHIKQTTARGETPKIRSLGKGNFALAIGTPNPIESTVEQANRETRKWMLEYLHGMAPPAFEQLIGALLVQIGFENVEVT